MKNIEQNIYTSKKYNLKKKTSLKNYTYLSNEVRDNICNNSHLGMKGYTIPKNILSEEELEFIKKDLFVEPFVPGGGYGVGNMSNPFPVYRENDNKIYIPRFYGIERYGLPKTNNIGKGISIDVPFVKPLRDYQENIVNTYVNSVTKDDGGSGGILQVYTGSGKCLGRDTKILMYDGTIKLVQDVVVGDLLMGDDSMPRTVLSLARGREQMYKIKPENGDDYIVNESHILSLKDNNTVIDISVKDYLNLPNNKTLQGYRVPVTFNEKQVEINPYLLGYWIGSSNDSEKTILYKIQAITNIFEKLSIDIFIAVLKKYDFFENKHIPYHYKCNSRQKQLSLLAGIIDSNGYLNNDRYEITHYNNQLTNDIIYLCRSLGFSAYFKKYYNSIVIFISGERLDEIPVRSIRHKFKKNKISQDVLTSILYAVPPEVPLQNGVYQQSVCSQKRTSDCWLKYNFDLEKLEVDDYYGFEIDGNRRFMLGDFTVTHNTVMALKICSELKVKTMILVHKEFLMNQWIERIQEYMPSARVGKIQAQTVDIDDKDIVIAMIQTMYNRVFPNELYSQFGLTIIDEVHRIGSEEFSKTLLRCVTHYMLGISATVERKDKMTKILYMFIGKLLYSSERKQDDPVCVRAIEFLSNDSEFNNTEVNFRGKPKYSTMISKLCEFGPRKDFIVKVLQDLIEENPDKQIIVLVHNRSLLNYFYESIIHRKFATTGFYVGGMKQSELKESEEKQIILATYAMAAEALDIKTLSTLVMATPKTDITQSVGRILRMKHDNPIIVDIVDSHDLFQNQWKQRKRYYKKCNYRIRYIDSKKYQGMCLDWNEDKTWLRSFEPKDISKTCDTLEIDEKKSNTIFGGKCCIDTSIFDTLK